MPSLVMSTSSIATSAAVRLSPSSCLNNHPPCWFFSRAVTAKVEGLASIDGTFHACQAVVPVLVGYSPILPSPMLSMPVEVEGVAPKVVRVAVCWFCDVRRWIAFHTRNHSSVIVTTIVPKCVRPCFRSTPSSATDQLYILSRECRPLPTVEPPL